MLAVHVTHEAARKMGGIGAVLAGLIPARAYQNAWPNSLLYGPLFDLSGPAEDRLGPGGRVLYSGPDGLDRADLGRLLNPIERRFGVGLVYGRRILSGELSPDKQARVEVVLADVRGIPAGLADELKFKLWERFGLESSLYPDWDYEQYLRLALPYLDLLEALHPGRPASHFGHEYMGLPCCLAVALAKQEGRRREDRTFFYAHEVAPARTIVENLPGHEVSFDNLLRLGLAQGRTLEDDFGSQRGSYRAELVKRAEHLSGVLAVSENVRDQLLYFHPGLSPERLHVAPNGVAFEPVSREEKRRAGRLLRNYGRRLFSFEPDYVFTHLTRLVVSKGVWRDVALLYWLDGLLAEQGLTGLYLLAATFSTAPRTPQEVARMEAEYGWPLLHRPGWPDLVGYEEGAADQLAVFNARSRAIKGVLINQFGFSREACGSRVPAGADLLTLRAGSDLELGLSVYEPFGIAQLETYPHGGLPAISRACGCSYLVERVLPPETFQVIDFSRPPAGLSLDPADRQALLHLSREGRDRIESALLREKAPALLSLIFPERRDELFRRMKAAAPFLGWEAAAERVVSLLR